MTRRSKRIAWNEWLRDLRAFGAGAACGLFGGAVLVLVLLSQYHLISWPSQNPNVPVRAVDDPGAAVIEPREQPSGTTGRVTSNAPAAVIGPEPSSPSELADRDLVIPVVTKPSTSSRREGRLSGLWRMERWPASSSARPAGRPFISSTPRLLSAITTPTSSAMPMGSARVSR